MKPRAITDDFVELHNLQEARFWVLAAGRWWQTGHFMKTLLKKSKARILLKMQLLSGFQCGQFRSESFALKFDKLFIQECTADTTQQWHPKRN
jgi:hypothetical protein